MNNQKHQLAVGLFFGEDDIPRIEKRLKNRRYARLWEDIRQTADMAADTKSVLFPDDTMPVWYYMRNRLMDLALYILLTRRTKHIAALNSILLDICKKDIDFWQGPHYPNRPRTICYHGETLLAGELETAQMAMGIAIAYDWGYASLTEEVRGSILEALRNKAIPLLYNTARLQLESWVMNHLCVLSVGLVLASLVLRSEHLPWEDAFELGKNGLDQWLTKIEYDGSYGESFHYWAYPTNCLFFGVFALKQVLNSSLKHIHNIERSFEWALHNQVGRYIVEGFDQPIAVAINAYDSPFLFQMEAPETLLYTLIFHNRLAQWYIETFLLDNPPRPDCLHHAWHTCNSILFALDDEKLQPMGPTEWDMPLASWFSDTGFIYLRDSWVNCGNINGDIVFSLLSGGGGKSCSHEHYDKNSFSLFAKGEYFITDPGHSCYRGEIHQSYDVSTCAHNTINIGNNQSLAFLEKGMSYKEAHPNKSFHNQAYIVGRNFQKDLSFIASEARKCYEPFLKKFTRRVWFIRPSYFVIWDRIDASNQVELVRCGFNVNNIDGKTTIESLDNTLIVHRPLADLQVINIFPSNVAFSESLARLHLAYHVLPGQAVEGRKGSAIRLNLEINSNKYDYVYILFPRGKDESSLSYRLHDLVTDDSGLWLESIEFTVTCNQLTSRFSIVNEDISYYGPENIFYRF